MFEFDAVGRRWMILVCAVAVGTAFLCRPCLGAEGTEAGATPLTNAADEPVVEVIRERYPDGKVKVEREVTTDADGNYVNHGAWRMWNELGGLIGEGRYENGRRTGQWSRWFSRGEAPLLDKHPFDEFDAPFVSRATFAAGELEGEWVVADAQGRKCSSVIFRHGKRDGTATLWQLDGEVCREATFRNGVAVGDVRERNSDGQLVTIATYVDGHQLVNKVTNFSGTDKKKSEAGYLAATVNEVSPDDFWQLRFAEYSANSESVRHGTWKTWYADGQVESEGTYQFDRENGKFAWWYANGQPAVEGQFVDGQEDGRWVWWHTTGQKAAQGDYRYGKLVGLWRGWSEDGRLVQRDEYRDGQATSKTQQTALQTAPGAPAAETVR